MTRKYLMVLVLSLLAVLPIGCATTPASQTSQQETGKYVANFTYTPAAQETPNSEGVTFTVGDITYNYHPKVDFITWYNFEQLGNLSNAVKQDFSNLLAAKGFSVRGPFESYDLIPFQDKKAIDLRLIPTLELFVTGKNTKHDYANFMLTSYLDTGDVEVTGKIILELKEIATLELLWSKSIPITKFEFSYAIRYPINAPNNLDNIVMDDVAKGIEKQYPDIMATIEKLIDPEEMGIIKKQAQELKNKKGY
ncbi:MAG: hypothetical protein L6416_12700 [Candidatus Omnitrophica bacterium]|nr:hypothetical protein [Candidatus Omnitrophota bacterium]